MRCHRSTMVLRGRGSAPAAALSGSLFLKPPALPEDNYKRAGSAARAVAFAVRVLSRHDVTNGYSVVPCQSCGVLFDFFITVRLFPRRTKLMEEGPRTATPAVHAPDSLGFALLASRPG
jgi:hypothetical protein